MWGPRPPAMERPTKFQPLRSTPSPSVKMGRKSKGQERSEGRGWGGNDLRHPPHFLLGRPVHSSWMTRQDQGPGTIWEWGGGRDPTLGQWVGLREEGGYHTTIWLQMMLNSISLRLMLSRSSSEAAFHVWPLQRKTPWETECHTQSKRL